jgi:hypothetical protein
LASARTLPADKSNITSDRWTTQARCSLEWGRKTDAGKDGSANAKSECAACFRTWVSGVNISKVFSSLAPNGLARFSAMTLSGSSGFGGGLETVRVGMNAELAPVCLGEIYIVVLRSLFDVGKRQSPILV